MTNKANWGRKLSPELQKFDFTEQAETQYRLIVEALKSNIEPIESVIICNKGIIIKVLKLFPGLVINLPAAGIKELAKTNYVGRIWNDTKVNIQLDKTVPAVGAAWAHAIGFTGKNVTIAVLDTGIYPHQDLIIPKNRIKAWKDLVNHKESPYDDNGHGTHVAGIIAGNGNTSNGLYQGIAPEAELVGVKVLDADGSGTISTIISGIEWCIENQSVYNIKVLNLSIGSKALESYRNDPLCRATSAAWERGITVCAAAGNDGPASGTIQTPGINPKIITVGNLKHRSINKKNYDQVDESSSRGPTINNFSKPDLLAPGVAISSLNTSGGYHTQSGSSMATAVVTGAVALVQEKWPFYRPDQIKKLLKKKARDLMLDNNIQGAGVLDLRRIFNDPLKQDQANTGSRF